MLNYGFKRDLNQYIADHVRRAFPIQSLQDVVDFNAAHMPAATKYDQDLAIFSQMFDLSPTSADTLRVQPGSRRRHRAVARRDCGVVWTEPTASRHGRRLRRDPLLGQQRRGHAGQGRLSEHRRAGRIRSRTSSTPPFPAGFNAKDGPAGVTFSGRAFSEPRLIGLAYAFEQATHYRFPPASAPALPSDTVIKK